MHQVVLYTKEGCHLCEQAKAKLAKLQHEFDLAIEEIDITQDVALMARYRNVIPVIVIDGETELASKITEYHLRKALAAMGYGPSAMLNGVEPLRTGLETGPGDRAAGERR